MTVNNNKSEFKNILDFAFWQDKNYVSPNIQQNTASTILHRERLIINIVYGHMQPNIVNGIHRGNVSILWSQLPIEGCNHYAYHNSFSFRGRRHGLNILIMLEPHVVLPGEFDEGVWKHFDNVLTLFDALIGQDKRFKKIFFPRDNGSAKEPVTEILHLRELLYPLSGRKNAICMISGNKHSHVPGELYSKRIEAAEWFHKNSVIPFDVYGRPAFQLANYRGAIPDSQKIPVLKQYQFSLCFENTNHQELSAGYVSEKILDCMETRTVPIYLGASNIEDYVSEGCFIDYRNFKGFEELDNYLRNMTRKEYEEYISAIDTWVMNGNLRKYSSNMLYDSLAELCAGTSSISLDMFYRGDKEWKKGNAVPQTEKGWQFNNSPLMWSWRHLSTTLPPVFANDRIANSKLASLEKHPPVPPLTKGGKQDNRTPPLYKGGDGGVVLLPTAHYSSPVKELTSPRKALIKVLVAGIKYHSGNAQRGYDYIWQNLFDGLGRFKNIQVQFYDLVTESQQRGIAGMSDRLLELIRKEQFDVFLYIPYAFHVDILPEVLRFITEHSDTQTIIWMNDDQHNVENNTLLWPPCVDYIVTTSDEVVRKYQKAGLGHKIIKSQWAFNHYASLQITIPTLRTRDISFIGSAKSNRPELIEKMQQCGLNVDVFGFGWPVGMIIPYQDMLIIYQQTKVNLNLDDLSGFTAHHIKRRHFEVPGCNGLMLTTPADNIEEYYEPDKEIVIASSTEELIEKSRYYLLHEHEREIIAKRGFERTIAVHTWTHRLMDIFKHIGFTAIPDSLHKNKNVGEEGIKVSITVTAYNQLHFTKMCVESILHYTQGPYEILLVDNGSSDGTYEYYKYIKTFHPNTRIIKYYQNHNVEALANLVYALATGKYIVAISNDTLVHEGWLERLIRHIESANDIGMIGPRSNNVSGPQAAKADYDTVESFHAFAGEWSRKYHGTNFGINRVVGMFYIIKKEVLERIGGWDPDLPTNGRDGGYGFSDDDFTLRLLMGGYKSLVANDVFIHHFGSVTSSKYRTDLFGPAQNINKEKYLRKLHRNDHIEFGQDDKITLIPYRPDEYIPVAENTVVRFPRIAFVVVPINGGPIQHRLIEIITQGFYDMVVLIDNKLHPNDYKIRTIIDVALEHPDVAITVPIGNYAPSTHRQRKEKESTVEIIQYADLSFSAINAKLIRSCTKGLADCKGDEDMFWFLQRRIRGEGYFIAKACNIVVDAEEPRTEHPYDLRKLPEQFIIEKRYIEAASIYREDLRKDPTFVESIYRLACIAMEQQNISEAFQHIYHSLEIDPHYIDSYIFLSRHFLEQGDMVNAERVIKDANMKQPGNPGVQKVVAEYERRKCT